MRALDRNKFFQEHWTRRSPKVFDAIENLGHRKLFAVGLPRGIRRIAIAAAQIASGDAHENAFDAR